jgi:DNA-binding beta-propeller fold protein YncE
MKYIRCKNIILFFLIISLAPYGCFKQIAEVREPLPDIIWPAPPEVPRIRFINSLSRPQDLNIQQTAIRKMFRFIKGERMNEIIKPSGITTDTGDRLFIVDNFLKTIHVFDSKNNRYYTFPKGKTSLVSPIDIAIDNQGFIYVSDSKEAVVKIFNENGTYFIKDIGGEILRRPTGIAVNNTTGELLVIDTVQSEVIRFDLKTHELKGKFGGNGSEPGLFHYPTHIFVSRTGQIFITDSLNFRIQIFSSEGNFLKTFGRPGDSPGYFARPRGVAVDSDGNIYVVDALFDNVQVFDKTGKLLMDFGVPGNGYGEFWLPSGIFIDIDDRIYISDSYNKRVQVFQYMKGDYFLNQ